MDHYTGGIEEIRATFLQFMQSVPEEGAVVVCGEDPKLVELAKKSGRRVVAYGFGEDCDTRISNYRTHGVGSLFALSFADGTVVDVELKCNPGIHNALNAAGVISVLWALGRRCRCRRCVSFEFPGRPSSFRFGGRGMRCDRC